MRAVVPASYRLSRRAVDDVQNIYVTGVHRFGVDQAERYQDGLELIFAFLVQFPRVARERPGLRGKSRVYRYQSHLIFYRLDGSGIFIQRVRHGREDWAAQAGPSTGSRR